MHLISSQVNINTNVEIHITNFIVWNLQPPQLSNVMHLTCNQYPFY